MQRVRLGSSAATNRAHLAFLNRCITLPNRSNTQTPAVRIAIQSIATPTWGNLDMPVNLTESTDGTTSAGTGSTDTHLTSQAAFRFLSALRLLVQRFSLNAAAVVTLPGYLIRTLKGGSALLRRLEWACDSVIELETFSSERPVSAR